MKGSRDSSVDIATGYELDSAGSIPDNGSFVSSLQCADLFWGPPSLQSNGYLGLFPAWVKQKVREANHSPPISAEFKNGGAISPLLHIYKFTPFTCAMNSWREWRNNSAILDLGTAWKWVGRPEYE
jgi:hypothetical protein